MLNCQIPSEFLSACHNYLGMLLWLSLDLSSHLYQHRMSSVIGHKTEKEAVVARSGRKRLMVGESQAVS